MGRSDISQSGQQPITVPVEDDDAPKTRFNLEERPAELQHGVRKIEAITQTWSRRSLWLTFVCVWLVYTNKSLDSNTTASLSPYATSAFKSHSLLPVLNITTSMVSAVMALPVAKLLNAYGRPEGFTIMILFSTLGSILSASTSTIGIYFGARVFKTLGNTGTDYVGNVLVADITTLLHREIFMGLNAVPFVFTIWAGPPIAQMLLDGSTWRWGYGAYAITTPIVAVPVVYMLFRAQHNAKKAGFETREVGAEVEGRTSEKGIWWQIRYWVIEFDVLGLVLLSTGFVLTLLAVTLAKSSGSTWRSAHTLVMIILGPIILVCFAVYERSYAPRPLIPFHLLRDRTVLGACLMSATMRVAYYIWDDYYSSYLQVVHGLSVTHAGYVERVYSLVACLWAPFLGYLISRVGRFKIFALVAVPVHALGAGLLIHFRHRGTKVAWLCFAQGLLGLGGATLTNTEELAVMAATTHSNVAGILAFKALFSYLGGAVGSAVAGALWLNLFPEKLARRLPEGSKGSAAKIFASLKTQLSYKIGSPEREAIMETYSDVQKVMTIASTVIVVLASGLVFIWRDLELKGRRQTPGRVLGAK